MRIKFLLLLALLSLSSCHVVRFFTWNFADIRDHRKFPNRTVAKADQPFQFMEATGDTGRITLPREISLKKHQYNFDEAMEKSGTVAFLVIRNDSLLVEKYYADFDAASVVPSFSVAKSFVSALVGIAIQEGHIQSVKEPITKYLSELDQQQFGKITIEHLLDMQSGIKYNEGYYNPFGDVARYYYGTNIKRYITRQKIEEEPGTDFNYISLNTQLLSLIVEKATGKTVDRYLEEKIWRPIGAEYDASWSVDSKRNGTVKAFCCLNARARDFAKFGRLYLHEGNWNGQQLINPEWVRESTGFTTVKNNFIYSYQWWHNYAVEALTDSTALPRPHRIIDAKDQEGNSIKAVLKPGKDFYAEGILGQFVYVYPEKNLILVRLGKKYGNIGWPNFLRRIAEQN